MKKETFYCLALSESQARFLATSKYGIDRMKALISLVELASTENRTYEKKGFSANLNVGQLVMSEVEAPAFIPCCASLPGMSMVRWLSIPIMFR